MLAMAIMVSLVSVIYPEIGKAAYSLQANSQNSTALVFEIKNQLVFQNQGSFTLQNLESNDPLTTLVQNYLDDHNSPLSAYAGQIVQLPNWKKALAISYVESNMGIHCVDNNCSGIGGAPGTKTWRKYNTKLDWFKDLDQLLSQARYTEKYTTCQKMNGYYVQPGSPSWVYGCEKVYSELTDLEEQAQAQVSVAHTSTQLALADTYNHLVIVK